MTLDEKLDLFYDTAMNEATEKNVQIIEEYKKSLQQTYNEHKASELLKAEHTLQLEAEKLKSERNKKLSAEALDIRKKITKKTNELKDILFVQITKQLEEFMKTEDYTHFLVKQIKASKDFAKKDTLTVYINPSDADKKELLEKETATELTISATDFFGGTRAVIHAKNILIDNSFMTRLAEEKEMFKL